VLSNGQEELGKVTDCGLNGCGFITNNGRIPSLSLEAHPASCPTDNGILSLGPKQLEHKADHPP